MKFLKKRVRNQAFKDYAECFVITKRERGTAKYATKICQSVLSSVLSSKCIIHSPIPTKPPLAGQRVVIIGGNNL